MNGDKDEKPTIPAPPPPEIPEPPPTKPGSPNARLKPVIRNHWSFLSGPDGKTIAGALVNCPHCLREIRIVPPRFRILDTGYIETRDEGRRWSCDSCRCGVGPMKLGMWNSGQIGF